MTPSSLSVCPGEHITINCTTSVSSTFLRWTVILDFAETLRVELDLPYLTQTRNEAELQDHDTGLLFHAVWSFYPFSSTFTTTASLALHNAEVTCRESAAASTASDTMTITMRGTYNDEREDLIIHMHCIHCTDIPAVRWLNATSLSFDKDHVTLVVKWNDGDQLQDNGDFIVVISPPINGSVSTFTTNKSSYHLTISYNSQHTIIVTASNCVGNNSTVNKTFNFSKCTILAELCSSINFFVYS